jgi:DNA-binding response OmpR family regulator
MLDIAMQGMDGLELAKQIHKKFGDDIGLVAITGAAVDDLRYKATFETVDHYFEKPVTLQQIQKLFSPWINGRAGEPNRLAAILEQGLLPRRDAFCDSAPWAGPRNQQDAQTKKDPAVQTGSISHSRNTRRREETSPGRYQRPGTGAIN